MQTYHRPCGALLQACRNGLRYLFPSPCSFFLQCHYGHITDWSITELKNLWFVTVLLLQKNTGWRYPYNTTRLLVNISYGASVGALSLAQIANGFLQRRSLRRSRRGYGRDKAIPELYSHSYPASVPFLLCSISKKSSSNTPFVRQHARFTDLIAERNGRKTLTTVQGLPKKFDQKKILKVIKKKFGTLLYRRMRISRTPLTEYQQRAMALSSSTLRWGR